MAEPQSRPGERDARRATRTLRDHLLRGYTLNERRLREKGFGEIEQAVGLLARTLTQNALVTDEGRAVLDVVQQYTRAWRLLLEYDEDRLAEVPAHPRKPAAELTLETARVVIGSLREVLAGRGQTTGLFGHERGDQLPAILGNIEQTFGGEPLYPTAQARAAHLLYFVIKDHPFSDGNKRIGFLALVTFQGINGQDLRATDAEVVTEIVALADGSVSEDDLAEWIRRHSSKR